MNHGFCNVVICIFILYIFSASAQRVQTIVGCEWNFLSAVALKI